ncbi:MAG: hypothetical protein V8T24_07950 [Roseburia hominis]
MSFQFTAPKLAVPENAYHVEHEIAELDDALRESGRSIQNMIAPRAVCAQIRELDASVNLLYGEDLIERMIAQDTVTEDETEKSSSVTVQALWRCRRQSTTRLPWRKSITATA